MKILLIQIKRRSLGLMGVFCALLSLSLSASAKENDRGAELIVRKKDGRTVKGELLTVKNGGILLMDSLSLADMSLSTEEIREITIAKKSRLFKSAGLGFIIGGVAGAALGAASGDDKPGLFSMTSGQKALFGGIGLGIVGLLSGGIMGTLSGSDEEVLLEGRPHHEVEKILQKLDAQARFPQNEPQDIQVRGLITQEKQDETLQATTGFEATSPQKKMSFTRIHISFKPGYFSSRGVKDTEKFFERIGFGDTEPAKTFSFFGISLGTSGPTDYPKIDKNPVIYFSDIRIEYSLTRNFALGIGYSPIGEHTVQGYKYIPVTKGYESYYSELFLEEKYSGALYCLSGSWMPIPDAYLTKVGFKLGAAAGMSQIKIHYGTSNGRYSNPEDDKAKISRKGLALTGFAELNYFFNRRLSLGVSAEYRYIPVKIGAIRTRGYYYDLDDDLELIESTMEIDLPEQKKNLGGFFFGLNLALHL